jgi:uncharacterized membrane protein YadS
MQVHVRHDAYYHMCNNGVSVSRCRFEIALGRIAMRGEAVHQDSQNNSAIDLALSKTKVLQFGVMFYGTPWRCTFGAISTVSSIVISVFLYMLGYSS